MLDKQIPSCEPVRAEIASSMLPPSFRIEQRSFHMNGRRLRGPVPSSFEAFYRMHLRFLPGDRLRSSDVNRFYAGWAAAADAPSLSEREIKRAMANIGHRDVRANGIKFCDVTLAAEHAEIPDNFPTLPLPAEARARTIADRLDAMITELTSIRAAVVGDPLSHS